MGSEGILVIAMALPPVWLAGRLWWLVTHSGNDLTECQSIAQARAEGRFRD